MEWALLWTARLQWLWICCSCILWAIFKWSWEPPAASQLTHSALCIELIYQRKMYPNPEVCGKKEFCSWIKYCLRHPFFFSFSIFELMFEISTFKQLVIMALVFYMLIIHSLRLQNVKLTLLNLQEKSCIILHELITGQLYNENLRGGNWLSLNPDGNKITPFRMVLTPVNHEKSHAWFLLLSTIHLHEFRWLLVFTNFFHSAIRKCRSRSSLDLHNASNVLTYSHESVLVSMLVHFHPINHFLLFLIQERLFVVEIYQHTVPNNPFWAVYIVENCLVHKLFSVANNRDGQQFLTLTYVGQIVLFVILPQFHSIGRKKKKIQKRGMMKLFVYSIWISALTLD